MLQRSKSSLQARLMPVEKARGKGTCDFDMTCYASINRQITRLFRHFPIHLMVFSYKIVKLKDDLCQILLHKSFWNSDWFSILKISMSAVSKNDKSRRSISVSETHIFKVPVLEINNFWYLFTAIYIIIHVSAGTLPRSLFFPKLFLSPRFLIQIFTAILQ